MGGRRRPEVLAHAAATVAFSDPYVGILSALLVNDTICLMLTPLVVAVIRRGKLPLLPFLIALATSANIGSVATLVGNPQNMIIGHFSRIPFSEFARSLAPAALVGLAFNFGIVSFGFRKCCARLRSAGNLIRFRTSIAVCLRSSASFLCRSSPVFLPD
jgi:Na+/H+ antiporter NhaD and related arsenite permeases